MTTFVGTSGWSYAHWIGTLYPEGLPTHRRLEQYTAHFTTVELNSSYYRWPRRSAFSAWWRRLPDGFVMTVKAPGWLTHRKRLYAPERWVARIRSDLAQLHPRCGVLLVQLPPTMGYD